MRCNEFEWKLRAENRDLEDPEVASHAAECTKCSALLDDELFVSGALGLLRAASADERVPDCLEERLLAEFRTRRPEPTSRRIRSGFIPSRRWLAAAALLLLAAGAIIVSKVSPPIGPGRGAVSTSGRPAVSGVAPPTEEGKLPTPLSGPTQPDIATRPAPPAETGPPINVARGRPVTRRRSVEPAARDTIETRGSIEGTPFYATMSLSRTDPPMDLQLVRVPVSRRTLEEFGITTDPLQPDRLVKADLLIGPDGLTRAIRFVSERR